MGKVSYLPASQHFQPEQALDSTKQMNPQDVLIVGYDEDGDLFIRSSHMKVPEALWLCEKLKNFILESV
ncbi:hypothetical protein P6F34_gp63 [Pseudomonas phage MiCath]|uniref:Uncharacterized protein n=1 Tax=Pseudomonas phage MiCath TaxID=3003729 RepID=A0AAE9VLL0_9CAUD|nr:hypothetical protein P6F34_gp63 [Pseudomonas phage MiCath]WAX22412.1 hypothetical protein [Pseudomonas phage MiCath]